uniref:Uncharacterized LOC102698729 n=1 Tax=Lepisosteus oculatus TaxID=7918 RepID=W5MPT4_LEPOC|nr:PREDICTED: uncharacterized protein LOC102698729 isoform X1 [Lepisosteus oculatus]
MISLYITLMFFCEVDISQANMVFQPHRTALVQLGDKVTMECYFNTGIVAQMFWFKKPIGESPICMATSTSNLKGIISYGEFKNNERVKVTKDKGRFTLIFISTESADMATYFCAAYHHNYMSFGNGTLLIPKGLETMNRSVVQQPMSVQAKLGDDVTLQCTIQTETCAGEHSVYWFRHGSGESLPGIIYTHVDRSDQCERNFEAGSPIQSCVYNLPKGDLNHSDAGTYYCAVAICGEILFGNGTLLEITDKSNLDTAILALGVTNTVCVIVIAVLVWTRNIHCVACSSENSQICHSNETNNSTNNQNLDMDMMNYAALKFSHNKTRRKSSEMDTQVVYADVRHQQMN